MYKLGCYKDFAIEACSSEVGSNADIRARPLPGQGVPTWMRVECSRKMRRQLTDSTVAILSCLITNREGGTHFMYAHFSTPYKLVSRREALTMIKRGELGFPEK